MLQEHSQRPLPLQLPTSLDRPPMRPRHVGAPKQRWTTQEEGALRAGVEKYGPGKWRAIQKDPALGPFLTSRSNVDLKDKWRNMTVALGIMTLSSPLREQRGSTREQRGAASRSDALFEDDNETEDDEDEDDDDDDYVDGVLVAHPQAHSNSGGGGGGGAVGVGARQGAPFSSGTIAVMPPRVDHVVVSGHHPWKHGHAGGMPVVAYSAPTAFHSQRSCISWATYDDMILDALRNLDSGPHGSSAEVVAQFLEERQAVPLDFAHICEERLDMLTEQGKLMKVRNSYSFFCEDMSNGHNGISISSSNPFRRAQSESFHSSSHPQCASPRVSNRCSSPSFSLPQEIPKGVRKRRSCFTGHRRRSLPPLSPSHRGGGEGEEEEIGPSSTRSFGAECMPHLSRRQSENNCPIKSGFSFYKPGNQGNSNLHGTEGEAEPPKQELFMGPASWSHGPSSFDRLAFSAPSPSAEMLKLELLHGSPLAHQGDAMDVDSSSSARTRTLGSGMQSSSRDALGLLKLALVSSSLTAGAARCKEYEVATQDAFFAFGESEGGEGEGGKGDGEKEEGGEGQPEEVGGRKEWGEEGGGEIKQEGKEDEEEERQGAREEVEEAVRATAARCVAFEPVKQEAMFVCSVAEGAAKGDVKSEPQGGVLSDWPNLETPAVHQTVQNTSYGAARTSPLALFAGGLRKGRAQENVRTGWSGTPGSGVQQIKGFVVGNSSSGGGTMSPLGQVPVAPRTEAVSSSGMDVDMGGSTAMDFELQALPNGFMGGKEEASSEMDVVKPPKKRWGLS